MQPCKLYQKSVLALALVSVLGLSVLFSSAVKASSADDDQSAGLISSAKALLCTSVDRDARIEIYFDQSHGDAMHGASASKMSVYDPNVRQHRQLVAKFVAADGLLSSYRNQFIAQVDLKNPNSSRRGERVGGTVLGALDKIIVDIDFAYAENVDLGAKYSATVTYLKRNRETLSQDHDCLLIRGESAFSVSAIIQSYDR